MLQSVVSKVRSSLSPHRRGADAASINDVADIYRIMLDRAPDASALDHYRMRIATGATSAVIVKEIYRSAEFQNRLADDKAAATREASSRFNVEFGERDAIAWFHSLEFPDGGVSNGHKALATLKAEADLIFKHGVAGKSVLDIGAWDGFFSFEAERRGAASVLSTDHFCWSGPGWGTKAGYDYAHAAKQSKARSVDVDVMDLDPGIHGRHDVVLFLGVLYHLKNPMLGLEKAAAMTNDLLIVETATALNQLKEPAMRYFPSGELNHDHTNFWAPNVACLSGMLRDIGFKRVETIVHPFERGGASSLQRHIAYAWKSA